VTTAAERLARRRAHAAARPTVDLTSQITSDVMNQGPRPTCVACTIAAAHEAERSGFEAAVEPIWWRLREWHLADEKGTTLLSAGQALSHTGHTTTPSVSVRSHLLHQPALPRGRARTSFRWSSLMMALRMQLKMSWPLDTR
jgi:hypothetical protein